MSTACVPADTSFTTCDLPELTREDLSNLFDGSAAASRVPRFLTPADCVATTASMGRLPLSIYNPEHVPTRICRFGPAVNDYRCGGRLRYAYWAAADRARVAWATAGPRPDPVRTALEKVGTAWGSPVGTASVNGRPLFTGALREMRQGTLVHFDDISRELPGLLDQRVVAQLAFNTWVSRPLSGGQTTIWRRHLRPADEVQRIAYGFHPSVVDGCDSTTYLPRVGDAALFNSARLHAVSPCTGRRISIGFFLGLTPDGHLIAWS
ncbi:proline hydroxylase [Streptomyces sp. NPDC059875]|uniref:proline hydroxylase n=1 Tax=unclassified Streptomyces TaxID=2593676 RepID=UPI003656674A